MTWDVEEPFMADDLRELHVPRTRRTDSLTFRWLTGILLTVILLGATAWARDVQGRVANAESALSGAQIQQAAMNQQLLDIKEQLVEIKSLLRAGR